MGGFNRISFSVATGGVVVVISSSEKGLIVGNSWDAEEIGGISRIMKGCWVSGRGSNGFNPYAENDSASGSSSGSSSGSKGSSSLSSGSVSCGSVVLSSVPVKMSSEVPEFDSGSDESPNVPRCLGGILSWFWGVSCRCYQRDVLVS